MTSTTRFAALALLGILTQVGCSAPKGGPQIVASQRGTFNEQINSLSLGMDLTEVKIHLGLGEFTKLGSIESDSSRIEEWLIHVQIYKLYDSLSGWYSLEGTKRRYLYFLDGILKDISPEQLQYREQAVDLIIEWRDR